MAINLEDTASTDRPYERQAIHRSEHEGLVTWVEDRQFRAACGPLDLDEALHVFRRWAGAEDGCGEAVG